jgi:hypothetical protein
MSTATAKQDWLSTGEFAAALRLKPQTFRKALCCTGSYFGVRPTKLPNGRLLWPASAIAKLTGGA